MNKESNNWTHVLNAMPQDGVEVETKIDDGKGCRNVATLIHQQGLWWVPDMSMYVYYSPTHWRTPRGYRKLKVEKKVRRKEKPQPRDSDVLLWASYEAIMRRKNK